MKTKIKYLLASLLVIATIVACTVPEVVTNPDGSTSTNQVVDPRLTAGITTGQAINTASAPLNPFWPAVSAILGSVAVIATAVAKIKTDQKNGVQSQLVSVVKGVNNAADTKTKEAISEQATTDGVETALNKTVKGVESGLL